MRSSRPSSRNSSSDLAVRELVAQRAGREWCLFVDRDGVMNRRVVGDYVRNWEDFEWLSGARLALVTLREWAPHIVVVTNQQGVGKGVMSADDLAAIHQHIQSELAVDNVTIDAFQVCPHLESAHCACRKPRPGLVLEWLRQNPRSEPSLSIMVGDSQSDLEAAVNIEAAVGGCSSVQIGRYVGVGGIADACFDSLRDFALAVARARAERDS